MFVEVETLSQRETRAAMGHHPTVQPRHRTARDGVSASRDTPPFSFSPRLRPQAPDVVGVAFVFLQKKSLFRLCCCVFFVFFYPSYVCSLHISNYVFLLGYNDARTEPPTLPPSLPDYTQAGARFRQMIKHQPTLRVLRTVASCVGVVCGVPLHLGEAMPRVISALDSFEHPRRNVSALE